MIRLPFELRRLAGSVKCESRDDKTCGGLFHGGVKVEVTTGCDRAGTAIHACAVDEFEYDFTNSNPFNWDLQPFSVGTGVGDGIGAGTPITAVKAVNSNVSHRAATVSELYGDEDPMDEGDEESPSTLSVSTGRTTISEPEAAVKPRAEEESDEEDPDLVLDDEMSLHFGRVTFESQAATHIPLTAYEIAYRDAVISRGLFPILDVGSRELANEGLVKSVKRKLSRAGCAEKKRREIVVKEQKPVVAVKKSPVSLQDSKTGSPESEDDGSKLYVCKVCGASFRVKGYLTRHSKKHCTKKPFECPFYAAEGEEQDGAGTHGHGTKCHPTGGFSRRDTFKTHLKALHFIYPTGTKSSQRVNVSGRCAGCFKVFRNNADWLKNHIETNECPAMVRPYK